MREKLIKLPKLKGKEYAGSMRGDIYYDHLHTVKTGEKKLKKIAKEDSKILTSVGIKHTLHIDEYLNYPVIVIKNRGTNSEERYSAYN